MAELDGKMKWESCSTVSDSLDDRCNLNVLAVLSLV